MSRRERALMSAPGRLCAGVSLILFLNSWAAFAVDDQDSDGVPDLSDNCVLVSNADQRDTDADQIGNICDADLNNDMVINGLDVGPFVAEFGTVGPDADFNGDNVVNGLDVGPFVAMFGQAPGPSAFVGSAQVTPGAQDFGGVLVGVEEFDTVTLTNTGYQPLAISALSVTGTDFEVFPPTSFMLVENGDTAAITLGFTPTAATNRAGTLTISTDAGLTDDQEFSVDLSGLGTDPGPGQQADIQLPAGLSWSSVPEGTTEIRTLSFGNAGDAVLTISNPVFSAIDFAIDAGLLASFPLSIAPGDTTVVDVLYTAPTGAAGTTAPATLMLTTNDPDLSTAIVNLTATVTGASPPPQSNPLLSARISFNPFDLITAATCASVGGELEFNASSNGTDEYRVELTDQHGTSIATTPMPVPSVSGMVAFNGLNACGLSDGIIDVEVIVTRGGNDLPPYFGTTAVKNTSGLAEPVLDPVEPVNTSGILQVCGTSRADTTVTIEGGTAVVGVDLDSVTTTFCLDVPLKPNQENTLIASAVDNLAAAPRPIAKTPPVKVVHLDPAQIVVAEATSTPLDEQEIATLVDNGVINLDDPSNFNVSIFTVVFTIGAFPVTITEPIAVPRDPQPGDVFVGSSSGGGIGGMGCTASCSSIVLIPFPPIEGDPGDGNSYIPGVIIIDGRIKTLKEFYQVVLALLNQSGSFTLADVSASINLPPGLTPIQAGPGADLSTLNADGAVETVNIGEIGPGETGNGQFIVRGDSIGTYNINVDYLGFFTGGGLVNPFAFNGTASTDVQVFGPPELGVAVKHPSVAGAGNPDVAFNEIYPLIVEITNLSSRPALYTSLDLFVGGDSLLVDENGVDLPDSRDVRTYGTIPAGGAVESTFLIKSLVEGDIIACQGIASENITLTIDTGPQGTPCNIVNTLPANFEPLPVDSPPTVIAINPLNGQPEIPVTTSVIATFTPETACLVGDTFTNIETALINPGDPGQGIQVTDADLLTPGTVFIEELDLGGNPVFRVPVDLTVETPPASGRTIAVLRLGLQNPNSQYFLKEQTVYRTTLVGADRTAVPGAAVCNASNSAPIENTFTWTFSSEQNCSLAVTPMAGLTQPPNASLDQPLNSAIVIDFSNSLDLATVTIDPVTPLNSSFIVFSGATESAGDISGGTPVAGSASFSNLNKTLTFVPAANLPEGQTIHMRLTDAITDTCGNALQTAVNGVRLFSFATISSDNTPPVPPAVVPVPVVTNAASIAVTGYAEVSSSIEIAGGAALASGVAGSASAFGGFSVQVDLTANQSNALSVTSTDASNNVSTPAVTVDWLGNPLVVFSDQSAPNIALVTPSNGSTDVLRDTIITVSFSEPIDPGTVNTLNVELTNGGGPVAGSLAVTGNSQFTFTPAMPLAFSSIYQLRLRAAGVRDAAGNGLVTDFLSSFTTESAPPPVLTNVTPGSALPGTVFNVTFDGSELATTSAIISANPDISGVVQSTSDTSVDAEITIAAQAARGLTTLGVSAIGGSTTLPFTVLHFPPVITGLSPNSGPQGRTVAVTIQGTELIDITDISIDGTGVVVNDLGTGSSISRDIELIIDIAAPLGSRTLSLTTPGGIDTASFTVEPAPPTTISFTPANTTLATRSSTNFTVNLSAPAVTGGQIVDLSADSGVVTIPAQVTVPQSATSETFSVDTGIGTGGATITGSASGLTAGNSTVTVQLRQFSINVRLVGLGRTTTASLTLSQAAPVGGATLPLSLDDPGLATLNPTTVVIAEGETTGTFDVTGGGTVGATTLTADGTADGFALETAPVTVSDQLLDFPQSVQTLSLGEMRTLQVLISPDPAPPGGLTIDITSDDPSVLQVLTPQVTIPEGLLTTTYDIQAATNAAGTAIITASNPVFASDTITINVTTGLDIAQSDFDMESVDTVPIDVYLFSAGELFPAPTGGVLVDLTSSDSQCLSVASTLTVPDGQAFGTTSLSYGGSATLPCTATLTASNALFGNEAIDVTVVSDVADIGTISINTASWISANRLGAGLQGMTRITLSESAHGGVNVRVTSGDPAVLRLAENATTIGASTINVFFADGESFKDIYVQGVNGATGNVSFTASTPLFSDGLGNVEVVPSRVQVQSLSSSTTTLSADDPFWVIGCAEDVAQTACGQQQAVSASAGALTVDVSVDDLGVAGLTTLTQTTTSPVTVQIPVNGFNSPTSVAAGGVALDPVGAGTVTVTPAATGFVSVPQTVTLTQPDITVNVNSISSGRLGAGLQGIVQATLGGSSHGGVTLRLTSSDPAVALVSADPNLAGAAFADVVVADTQTQATFYVQGVAGASGPVTLTASSALFADDMGNVEVVPSRVQVQSLSSSTTTLSADDPFWVIGCAEDVAQTACGQQQAVSASAGALTVDVSVDDLGVAGLTTLTQTTTSPVTVQIPVNGFNSPTSVAAGGVALDPVGAGTVTVTPAATGFVSVPQTVTLTQPDITVNVNSISSGRLGAGLQGIVQATLGGSSHGGVTLRLTSSDPAVALVSADPNLAGAAFADVVVADTQTQATFYVQGVAGASGPVTLTASSALFADDMGNVEVVPSRVQVQSLSSSTTTLSADDPFWVIGCAEDVAQTACGQQQAVSASAGALTVDVSVDDLGVAGLTTLTQTTTSPVTVQIPVNALNSATSVAAGGVALDPVGAGTVTVTPAATGFVSVPQTVTLTQPDITVNVNSISSGRLGAGLQGIVQATLGGSSHGGVTLRLTSSDPAVALVSADPNLAGAAFADVVVADTQTQATFYVQGVAGASGPVTLTASSALFADDMGNVEVVPSRVQVQSLSSSTTTLSADDPFWVIGCAEDVAQTACGQQQAVSASAGALTVDVSVDDLGVAGLTTLTQTTTSPVTVQIPVNGFNSPTSVAAGGVALDPVGAGTVTVTPAATGFVSVPQTVTLTQPDITVNVNSISSGRLGAGLQGIVQATLGGSSHGGVTLRLTSSDPAVALVSADPNLAGAAFADVVVADTQTQATFYVQGVAGASGPVTLTASSALFADDMGNVEVVPSRVQVQSLSSSTTTLSADDPFWVIGCAEDVAQTACGQQQAVSASAGALTVDVSVDDLGVAGLTTLTQTTTSPVTVQIPVNALNSATSVAAGGVALDPVGAGTVTVTPAATNFVSVPQAVTVNP